MSMLSALVKTYYAEKAGIDPKKIFVVAVMPCVAKKFEAARAEHLTPGGAPYTDAVLTTRELIWMIKCYGIDFDNLPTTASSTRRWASPPARATSSAPPAASWKRPCAPPPRSVTGKELANLDFDEVRGVEGVKEASVDIGGTIINVGVANGLQNAKTLLDKVVSGEKQYHLIEIMACPGGCIGGGGQPYPPGGHERARSRSWPSCAPRPSTRSTRSKTLRKSHENPAIEQLYEHFLGEPEQPPGHELLHTHYHAQVPARCAMSPETAARTAKTAEGPGRAARARSSGTSSECRGERAPGEPPHRRAAQGAGPLRLPGPGAAGRRGRADADPGGQGDRRGQLLPLLPFSRAAST